MSKLQLLRTEMLRAEIDVYLVPLADYFGSEYLPRNFCHLQWLTGFSGSAGFVIIAQNKAAFFTDGRYAIESKIQISAVDFEIYNIADLKPEKWCEDNLNSADRIGFDAWLFTQKTLDKYASFNLVPVNNLIDQIWQDKPQSGTDKIFTHNIRYAGQSFETKVKNISSSLKKNNIFAEILCVSESTNWLLNIRGNDLPHTPFALSFAIIYQTGAVDLFIDKKKVNIELSSQISTYEVDEILNKIASFSGQNIQIDEHKAKAAITNKLHEIGANICYKSDSCEILRACKNQVEIQGARNAHLRDGVALVRFFAWLKGRQNLTEITASNKLEEFRKEGDLFKGLSFDTISAFGKNGAIIHYKADIKTAAKLTQGLYLLDSGGQYLDGTTDVTRTIYLGDEQPSEQMKSHFTLVLKGHIALAMAVFSIGTTGCKLDNLARQYLLVQDLDYDHGTGHGVGSYMNVHEGPQRISKAPSSTVLQEGMIISNEPGFYLEGEYGIRIESLVNVVANKKSGLLEFQTLTKVPIDLSLLDIRLLTKLEISWLNKYHSDVYNCLAPSLNDNERKWLKAATKLL